MNQELGRGEGDSSLDHMREAARAARLRYVSADRPGITRQPTDNGFAYLNPDGSPVTDEAVLARIRKLAIPPAYVDVWICRDPNGHLQAVGRDARGRKQYRYHPRWRATRDEGKYTKMTLFGEKLPLIRAQVERDLAAPGLPKRKVVAALVRLLEGTLARIGNEEYAKANKSFGLTTLRNRHVRIAGAKLAFDFRAKHGIQQHIELRDRRLAALVARLRDLPGQDLFQYLDSDGERHSVGSDDVNDYLREVSGEDITAKDFRTWAATNLAALALQELHLDDAGPGTKKNITRAVETVSKRLGNTPTICRKCYIHPAIFDGYLDGSLLDGLRQRSAEAAEAGGLTDEERSVVAYLTGRLTASNVSTTA